MVYENARITDNASISCNSQIYGNAHIFDNVSIMCSSEIFGTTRIYGDVFITNHVKLSNLEIKGKGTINKDLEITPIYPI